MTENQTEKFPLDSSEEPKKPDLPEVEPEAETEASETTETEAKEEVELVEETSEEPVPPEISKPESPPVAKAAVAEPEPKLAPAAPAPAPAKSKPSAESKPEQRWYVVHTLSGHEQKVRNNLEKRIDTMNMKKKIFQVLVPTEEEVEIKSGKKRIVKRKIFPGYVLVEMLMGDDSWYVVRNTAGVTGFVGSGGKPLPLPEEEVKLILKQTSGEAPKRRLTLKTGDKVRVTSGPFVEFYGAIQEVNPEKEKIKVAVSIFGRETPVELDYGQVEKL